MPSSKVIKWSDVESMLEAAFEKGEPHVYLSYSAFGQEAKLLGKEECKAIAASFPSEKNAVLDFAIWYPSTGGGVELERIESEPKYFNGHTFRYRVLGWGVIHLQFWKQKSGELECSVSVNSEKRALAWVAHIRNDPEPQKWHWKEVESHSRRLQRRLSALTAANFSAGT